MGSSPSAFFQVKATDSAGAARNYSAKSQTKSEQLEGSRLSPQSSAGKKEEIAGKGKGAQNSLSREKVASGKEEKTTPKKEKVSPKKAEVGAIKTTLDVWISGVCRKIVFIYYRCYCW